MAEHELVEGATEENFEKLEEEEDAKIKGEMQTYYDSTLVASGAIKSIEMLNAPLPPPPAPSNEKEQDRGTHRDRDRDKDRDRRSRSRDRDRQRRSRSRDRDRRRRCLCLRSSLLSCLEKQSEFEGSEAACSHGRMWHMLFVHACIHTHTHTHTHTHSFIHTHIHTNIHT